MSGRPHKSTVEYFPHEVSHGKTLFVMEQAYGNDGYAFWFKLLELLGGTSGHFLDCRTLGSWDYLTKKTGVKNGRARTMVDTLSNLEAIDSELWKKVEVIWSDNFVERLKEVYRKRQKEAPKRPNYLLINRITGAGIGNIPSLGRGNTPKDPLPATEEVEEVEEVEEREYSAGFEKFWKSYPVKKEKRAAYKEWKTLKPDDVLFQEILSSIKSQISHKESCDKSNTFCPEFPYGSRWIKKKKWEDEQSELTSGNKSLTGISDEELEKRMETW